MSGLSNRYTEKRKKFYQGISDFWPDLYGEEYALYDIATIGKDEAEQIRLATNRIGKVFFKVSQLLREIPKETLVEMGYPTESLSFIKLQTLPFESVIARLDLVKTTEGYKCLEINSDTPTFIKELFAVNGLVCKEFQVEDPNAGMELLMADAIKLALNECAKQLEKPKPYIVFTAHEENIEDRETVIYLQKLAEVPSRFVPLHQLKIERGKGLYDENGLKIDILYRQTFPIENLVLDEDQDGNSIGLWLLELVESGQLQLLNPPSAFLLQNKAVQAVIWGLHLENSPFFTGEEHDWIEEYFLPTFFEPDYFLENQLAFVKKPSFGREGDTVEIFAGDGNVALQDSHQSYTNYLPIYQQYIELPSHQFNSRKGMQTGNLLIGSFLLNGRAAAMGFRVGERITNNLSYYLPVGLQDS
ncbi:glutathionylspermidine synthase family protein [Mesobacillus maritimus]|uniref:glutathionylspermidine synthase family protein n=1 Tax=Mesobacillus maritimus TaxID=1643336 RepID=UPI00203F8AC0|nr:glutathionylspermidine synthase family protein [Mesobacillus maritimus]MCM3587440.1 glutathionylspermidine synthase family protein [Mesobacillus maritimus]MCM3672180.1 glutathionylspermidine synthase family protein [Mesobacillus maritimus]